MTAHDDLISNLKDLELFLHKPAARSDMKELAALLHDEFLEFGRSGRAHDKTSVLRDLPLERGTRRITAQSFVLSVLSPDCALLTYETAEVDQHGRLYRRALRSSIWTHTEGRWQLRFHQGTPVSPE